MACERVRSVMVAFSTEEVRGDYNHTDPIRRSLANAMPTRRAGDAQFVLKPYWLKGAPPAKQLSRSASPVESGRHSPSRIKSTTYTTSTISKRVDYEYEDEAPVGSAAVHTAAARLPASQRGRLLLSAVVAAVLLLLAAEAVAGSSLDREEIELSPEIEEIRFASSISEY